MPTTDSFTSSAAGLSSATATLTVLRTHSLVSTAAGVSAAVAARPFKLNVLGEIKSVPYYDPAVPPVP